MKQWLKSWNTIRLIRLAMAVFLIIQGFEIGHWLVVGAGVLFVLMPILNIGSCSTGMCNTNFKNIRKK